MAKQNAETTTQSAALVTVTLKMPHTHGGKDYAPGDPIEVTEAQKAWLTLRDIIIAE